MTSAIMNPVRAQEMEVIRAANLLMNHDDNGGEWIRFAKVLEAVAAGATFAEAAAAASSATSGRRGGRRRARLIPAAPRRGSRPLPDLDTPDSPALGGGFFHARSGPRLGRIPPMRRRI